MKRKSLTLSDWLRSGVKRICYGHFVLLLAFAVQTVVMDAWHVIVPEIVLKRWLASAVVLSIVAVVWYLAHNRNNDIATYKRLVFSLVASDIAFAAYNVYLQRGMAAKAVALFAVPIIVSAVLLSRSAIFATAMLSTAAYLIASVSYFVLHFNEGYKTELYAETAFYAASFFVIATLLSVVVRFGGDSSDA